MQFAVTLLIILAIVCSLGSFVTQGQNYEWYAQQYSERIAAAIVLFGIDDVFHCWWFVALTLLLCVDLLGCNLIHFSSLWRQFTKGFQPEKILSSFEKTDAMIVVDDAETLIKKLGFWKVTDCTDVHGRSCKYAVKNKTGIWGAWLTHLGILIVIIGFGLGQMLKTEYSVYGISGQTKPIGDTGYELTIDDFQVELRGDDTVEQYTALLTMRDVHTGEQHQGTASVNAPLSLFGMKLYQNSTGWAATVEVKKNGEPIQLEVLCAGEYLLLADKPDVAVVFSAFYPDYAVGENGIPVTLSGHLHNPAYLYRLYYHDQMIGMNVLKDKETITMDEYEVIFSDPQSYTVIQVKKDQFQWLAAIGGGLILIALILAFYLIPAQIWAVQMENGLWYVGGKSRKGGIEFIESIKRMGKEKR